MTGKESSTWRRQCLQLDSFTKREPVSLGPGAQDWGPVQGVREPGGGAGDPAESPGLPVSSTAKWAQ